MWHVLASLSFHLIFHQSQMIRVSVEYLVYYLSLVLPIWPCLQVEHLDPDFFTVEMEADCSGGPASGSHQAKKSMRSNAYWLKPASLLSDKLLSSLLVTCTPFRDTQAFAVVCRVGTCSVLRKLSNMASKRSLSFSICCGLIHSGMPWMYLTFTFMGCPPEFLWWARNIGTQNPQLARCVLHFHPAQRWITGQPTSSAYDLSWPCASPSSHKPAEVVSCPICLPLYLWVWWCSTNLYPSDMQ